MRALQELEKEWSRKKSPRFSVGDTVEVHVRIIEGDRERIQIFNGDVIAKRHGGLAETFTVRRLVQGEGVERVFPLHSPRVVDVVVKKKGHVRRAKLHYLRDRVGRGTRIEQRFGVDKAEAAAPVEPAVPAPAAPAPEAKKAEQPSAPAK
jgi:large subunit ribosomal protein L19